MPEAEIKSGYLPGVIGRVAELHGRYYNRHWGFGVYFEAKVASEISEFCLQYDEDRDSLHTVILGHRIHGAVVIDGIHADTTGAHLRWFILSDALRGMGMGNRLMEKAVDFCRTRGYHTIYLNTFEGLDAARHLYEKAGFEIVSQQPGKMWGTEVNEQRFELHLE